MIIYKLTNRLNNKCYIGTSTEDSLKETMQQHRDNAATKSPKRLVDRALKKYRTENFSVKIIEQVATEEELKEREQYWIEFYNSIDDGYNEKNPNKRFIKKKVKCLNAETGEELHFNSLKEMQNYFGENDHKFITRRCNHKIKCLYKGIWNIAYEEDDYLERTPYKNNPHAKEVLIITPGGERKKYHSGAAAAKDNCLPPQCIKFRKWYKKQDNFYYQDYRVISK